MTTKQTTMRRTWLVQRLSQPRSGGIFGKDNPFAFGGGLVNGGLSPDAMDALRDVFSFDYMGAAEFEFGAVPKALSGLAESHKDLVAETTTFPLRYVPANWRHPKDAPEPEGDATVYILCRRAHLGEVRGRVQQMARRDLPLKEWTNLDSTLRPAAPYDGDTVGWLELDNGFMFFTDRDMWVKTCALFGIQAGA